MAQKVQSSISGCTWGVRGVPGRSPREAVYARPRGLDHTPVEKGPQEVLPAEASGTPGHRAERRGSPAKGRRWGCLPGGGVTPLSLQVGPPPGVCLPSHLPRFLPAAILRWAPGPARETEAQPGAVTAHMWSSGGPSRVPPTEASFSLRLPLRFPE